VLGPPHIFDVRSDIYSVGALAYYLLAGCHVFEAEDDMEYFKLLCTSQPAAPSVRTGRGISPDLERVVMQCLRSNPEERPQRIEDVAEALRCCAQAGLWSREKAYAWWQSYVPAPAPQYQADDRDTSFTIEPDVQLNVDFAERK